MWVLIVLYFSGGNPAIAMHDFTDRASCEAAVVKAQELGAQMKGYPQVKATCTPKAS